MENKKRKLFGIFNILDIGIILLIAALAVGTVYKFKFMDKTSKSANLEPIAYTVEVKNVRNFVFSNVKEGDILFDKTSGNAIGTITAIEGTPALTPVEMLDGSVVMGESENRYDILFTLEGEGVISDDGYFINKTYELLCGSKKKFMTKYFECEGSVKDIL